MLIVVPGTMQAAILRDALHGAGITVDVTVGGEEAIVRKEQFRPDIAVVDLDLPDWDGRLLVSRFMVEKDCGVIAIMAKGAAPSLADDHLVQPVLPREVVARVGSLHRRRERPGELAPGSLLLDRRCGTLSGPLNLPPAKLTQAEMAALETLLDAEGATVSRAWLTRVVAERMTSAEHSDIDRFILRLRRKLMSQGAARQLILAASRQGFVIRNHILFRQVEDE